MLQKSPGYGAPSAPAPIPKAGEGLMFRRAIAPETVHQRIYRPLGEAAIAANRPDIAIKRIPGLARLIEEAEDAELVSPVGVVHHDTYDEREMNGYRPFKFPADDFADLPPTYLGTARPRNDGLPTVADYGRWRPTEDYQIDGRVVTLDVGKMPPALE